jgi:hypothetical protein
MHEVMLTSHDVVMMSSVQQSDCHWEKPSVRTEICAVRCKKQTARHSRAKACPAKQIMLLACRSDDRQRDAHLHAAQVACVCNTAGSLCEAAAEVSTAGADHLWGC